MATAAQTAKQEAAAAQKAANQAAAAAKKQANEAAAAAKKQAAAATKAANQAAAAAAKAAKKNPTTVTDQGDLLVNPGATQTGVVNVTGAGSSTFGNWLLSLGGLLNGNSQSQADLTANQQAAEELADENNPVTPSLTFTPVEGAQTTSTLIGAETDGSTLNPDGSVTDQGFSLMSLVTWALLAVAALFLIFHHHHKKH